MLYSIDNFHNLITRSLDVMSRGSTCLCKYKGCLQLVALIAKHYLQNMFHSCNKQTLSHILNTNGIIWVLINLTGGVGYTVGDV